MSTMLNREWLIYACPGCLQQREGPTAPAHCDCIIDNAVPHPMVIRVYRLNPRERYRASPVRAALEVIGNADQLASRRRDASS